LFRHKPVKYISDGRKDLSLTLIPCRAVCHRLDLPQTYMTIIGKLRQTMFTVAVLGICSAYSAVLRATDLQQITGFGSNPGNLRMWLYVPENLAPSAPLVVALHGCRQSASDYDDETGWKQYADSLGFALLLPEQKAGWWPGNNPAGCFNWFYRDDQRRGSGEPASIRQMIDKVIADHKIDPKRVYVTGLSAGGAMTAVMLAVYPEYFAGGAVISGIPYRCTSVSNFIPHLSISYWAAFSFYTDPFACMIPGRDLRPAQWGNLVRTVSGVQPSAWPIVSVWQGEADSTVARANGLELVEQWTNVHGVDATADTEENIKGHIHRVYHNPAGEAVVELYLINGGGHGTPVDPAPNGSTVNAPDQCGIAATFVLPANICASYYIAKFWGLVAH